jgi:leucyl-tRNA synthetase
MKLMMPFTPYLANECLEAIGCESTTIWPKTESNSNIEEIKLPVQVNGKTRDIMLVKKDTDQESVNELVQKVSKANKYIANKEIIKIIYVKNRIINYIIKV